MDHVSRQRCWEGVGESEQRTLPHGRVHSFRDRQGIQDLLPGIAEEIGKLMRLSSFLMLCADLATS